MRRAAVATTLVLTVLLPCSMATLAQPPAPPVGDHARMIDAGQGAQGRIAINQTAGYGNVQANHLLIGAGSATAGSAQHTAVPPSLRLASARIEGDAFARVQGALAINQSAGTGNAQANLLLLGGGATDLAVRQHIAALDDAVLAGVGARPASAVMGPARAPREAVIDTAAFRGSQGVLQLSQTAGSGNASVNAIVLQLPGAAR